MALELLAAALACFVAGAGLGILAAWWPGARTFSAAAALVGAAAVAVLGVMSLGGTAAHLALPGGTLVGGFAVRTGALPGAFLLLTGIVGGSIAIYSEGYGPQLGGPPRQAAFWALFNPTLASLVLILVAADAVTFLVAWELMSILTYVLAVLEYDHRGVPEAGFLMLALSEVGFLCLIVAFALIGGFSGRDFAQLAAAPAGEPARSLAFVLLLFGFGAKAGVVPLQGWLPEAHPAAPANVSSLLSGVVVKMAVFGILLTCVQVLGMPPVWWGALALAAGVVTAIYGILFSLLADDLKRALAFSTIENLGFIVALIGAALVFRSAGRPLLAGVAVAAAVLHSLNHSVLKGGLFLGAGSVQAATGTRDMDRLGGLSKRMPWTTLSFFVLALGLAGVPPLNGFLSEWLGLQTLLQSHLLASAGARVLLATSGAVLALALALAVTTYVRIVGGGFLGRARSRGAETANEVALSMRVGQGVLAAAAIVLGLLPPLGVGAAAAAAGQATGTEGLLDALLPPIFTHPQAFSALVTLGGGFLRQLPFNGLVVVPANPDFSSVSPTYIFLTMAALIGVVAGALRLMRPRAVVRKPVWTGAGTRYAPAMQYTATGFTNVLRFVFGSVYSSTREIQAEYAQAPFFARTIRYSHRFVEPVDAYLYRPVVRASRGLARRAWPLQAGNVSLYLVYLLVAFLAVLFIQ